MNFSKNNWFVDRCDLTEEDVCELEEEVEIMSVVDHPNITKFIDVYEDEAWFCLVYELMAGGMVRQDTLILIIV